MAASGLRSVAVLTDLTSGITRLRDKGGASPQALYDLQNGYVNVSGCPVSRDGTTLHATLPSGTKGLVSFQGKLHVFALSALAVPTGYVCDILIHPDPSFTGTIDQIYFAKPFLGNLYVVAGFSDGSVYHYWLQAQAAWQADTVYLTTDAVRPSTPNGFQYAPTTSVDPPAWTASTNYKVGDVVQPSVYNGYQYTVVSVQGDPATSGTTEPTWPTTEGAQVYDFSGTTTTPTSTSQGSSGSPAGSRYDNMAGTTYSITGSAS